MFQPARSHLHVWLGPFGAPDPPSGPFACAFANKNAEIPRNVKRKYEAK
jgi:hypothetical protein